MPAVVAHDDQVAVAALPAGELDDAVADRAYPRARGRRVVHALVRAPGSVQRVHAHAESGADARELERRAQQRLAHVLAVRGVIAVGVPERAVPAALVGELGGEHAPRAQRPAVDRVHFVEHRETVCLPQLAVEIDIAGEYVGKLDRDGVRNAGGVGGREERRSDERRFHLGARHDLRALLACDQALAGTFDPDDRIARGEKAQPDEFALMVPLGAHVGANFGGNDGARAQQPQFALAQKFLHIGFADGKARKQSLEGVAALQAILAYIGGRRRQQRFLETDRDRLEHRRFREQQFRVGRGHDGGDRGDRTRERERRQQRGAPK